jgi:ABC-type lipoprotein release transport system permease subunit
MRRFGRGGSLRHTRLQLVLAVAAIGAAVALPVVLISVGGGVAAHELANLENAGYQIVVSASGLHGISGAHALSDRILALPSVTAASPVLSIAIDAVSPHGKLSPVLAEGVVPTEFTPTLGPTENGLFPQPLPLGDPTDTVHYANGTYRGPATYDVLLSTPYADAYGITVGDRILLSPSTNTSLGTEYNVTGVFGVPPTVLGPTGAFAVLLPLSDLQVMTGFAGGPSATVTDAADTVQVAVTGSVADNPAALGAVRAEVQGIVPYYSVTSLNQEAQQLQSASGVLTGFYLALSSVGLTVGLLFLALVLLRRVESNRRSIGIRRALGIPGRTIAVGIAAEGLGLAVAGALAGLVGGFVLVESLARWASAAVQEAAALAVFDPIILAELVAGVAGLSLLASALATRSALRLDITEALR